MITRNKIAVLIIITWFVATILTILLTFFPIRCKLVPQSDTNRDSSVYITDTLPIDIDLSVLPSEYTMSPVFSDDILIIDWQGGIIITDALSQTMTISGPATVRFEEEHD